MIAFEIYVNGEKWYTVGADDPGVVSAIVAFGRRRDEPVTPPNLMVSATNLAAEGREDLEWPEQDLAVGDEVTIRVIECSEEEVTPPVRREKFDSKMNEKRKLEFYYQLRAEIEAKHPRPRFRRVR